MDKKVMELRIRQWISVFEEQAHSGLTKNEWCSRNGISRSLFFRWQGRVRAFLLEQEKSGQLVPSASPVNSGNESDFFVELPTTQGRDPEAIPMQSPNAGFTQNAASPLAIHYHDFSVSVSCGFDELQLAAVLRALKYVG